MEQNATRKLCLAAVFAVMNIALCAFGLPVPGGKLYFNDVVIAAAALLFDPFSAFLVGGVGSFFGDMIFYPPSMFVSLVVHGLQAVVISLLSRRVLKSRPVAAASIATAVGAVIMVVGYTLGKTYFYSTYAYAIIKLPWEIAQGVIGAVGAVLLCYQVGLKRRFDERI